jgi:hypothetical protein
MRQRFRYFQVSTELVKSNTSQGLDTIRAVICQARFLASASAIPSAYTTVCRAIGMALRAGFHASDPPARGKLPANERFQQRRVLATLNMMDTYLSSLLGLPKNVQSPVNEQPFDLEDEARTRADEGIALENPYTPANEALLCQQINVILSRIYRDRYLFGQDRCLSPGRIHDDDIDWVMIREAELSEWHARLPPASSEPPDRRALQAQLTLRLWYTLVQIALYRPFLRHLAHHPHAPNFNMRAYGWGSACVRAAMQAIWIIETFAKHGMPLHGTFLIVWLLTMSASILAFFVTWTPQRATVEEGVDALRRAKDLLSLISGNDVSAGRCLTALNSLPEPVIPHLSSTY